MATPLESIGLRVRRQEPFNAGPEPEALVEGFLTANPQFFARNHGPVPEIDEDTFRLHIGGRVHRSLELSLDALRHLPACTVTATLECAGNRRGELSAVRPIPDELEWGAEAIGTAQWRGAPLRDVLELAGLAPDASHVEFLGLDRAVFEGAPVSFGASIPLEKALAPEVLLAYEMNGTPLPRLHGGPLRAVVPGYIGARSVKWLGRIEVRDAPSTNPFQARAYRLVRAGGEGVPATAISLGEAPVTSAICSPANGDALQPGRSVIRGYAYAGGGTVGRVEVSVDGGRSFLPARLLDPPTRWVWSRWTCEVDLKPGLQEIVARAFDAGRRGQPARLQDVWNPKGYANNAWHRVRVYVLGTASRLMRQATSR